MLDDQRRRSCQPDSRIFKEVIRGLAEMDRSPFIRVRRCPYEEPYHTQVTFHASNGLFMGTTDIYLDITDLEDIGLALEAFPRKVPDEYRFEHGSERAEDRFRRYFLLRVFTTDYAGHCAIQFRMNLNEPEPRDGKCTFSISAEAGRINRLGALFLRLHKSIRGEVRWGPIEGETFEENAGERVD